MDDREAARELLRDLGASEEQLASAEQQRDLQGFVSDVVLARGRTLTVADVAARAKVDPERVVAMWRALGVTVEDPTAPIFSEEDAGITEIVLHRGVFDDEKGDDVLRVIGGSVA